MPRSTKIEVVDLSTVTNSDELRQKELVIFRRRVKTYGMKVQVANRGLTNKFKEGDL